MRLLVLDTETTGLDPAVDKIVEYAHVVLDTATGRASRHREYLCDPGVTIPPTARAVHHIGDADVTGRRSFVEQFSELDLREISAIAAHNAEFDVGMIRGSGGRLLLPVIDTYRCAKHLWPDAPAYGNQVLRYWRGVEPLWPAGRLPSVPHRALYDACTTAAVLWDQLACAHDRLIPEDSADPVNVLLRLTHTPVLLTQVTFGKHAGTPWSDVPLDYLRWALTKDDWDDDQLFTIRHHHDLHTGRLRS